MRIKKIFFKFKNSITSLFVICLFMIFTKPENFYIGDHPFFRTIPALVIIVLLFLFLILMFNFEIHKFMKS